MKKFTILIVLAFIGLAAAAQERQETAPSGAKALIPVSASIEFFLQPNGPSGDFWIETSRSVRTSVKYTVTFRGHTTGDLYFTVNSGSSSSLHKVILQAIAGRAAITAVSPETDGVYDYTAAIGAEIEW